MDDINEGSEMISSSSSLHTDYSVELELDLIPKKQEEIDELELQLTHFNIGNRKFLIEENSPIFNLSGPFPPFNGDHPDCHFCSTSIKKGKSTSC
jgi:hypothetical protein